MSDLKIWKKANGTKTQIENAWETDSGDEEWISIIITEDGLNIAATGTLNKNGIAAFKELLAMAEIIYSNGGVEMNH